MWPAGADESPGKGREGIHIGELRKVMVLHNHPETGAAVIICTRLLEHQAYCHSHVKRNHCTLTLESRHSIHPIIPCPPAHNPSPNTHVLNYTQGRGFIGWDSQLFRASPCLGEASQFCCFQRVTHREHHSMLIGSLALGQPLACWCTSPVINEKT